MEEVEKKNRRIAGASTIAFHAVLLIVAFFAIGWRAPNPPWSSPGIELNFGLDDQGSGDIQPETPVGTTPEKTTEPTQETPAQEQQEEAATEPQPKEEQITAKDETAVPVEDVKKDQPKEKPVEKTPEKPTEKPVEKPKETVNPNAVYKPNTDAKSSDAKTGQAGSHGDDVNKPGDKGNPQGTLRSDALYGRPGGGGGGPGLSIDGWFWDEVPSVKAPTTESSGRVVFEIKVNSEGEIISIKTLERSLSLEMEAMCKREIEKLTFSKTGLNVPAVSTGKITFVVLSK